MAEKEKFGMPNFNFRFGSKTEVRVLTVAIRSSQNYYR